MCFHYSHKGLDLKKLTCWMSSSENWVSGLNPLLIPALLICPYDTSTSWYERNLNIKYHNMICLWALRRPTHKSIDPSSLPANCANAFTSLTLDTSHAIPITLAPSFLSLSDKESWTTENGWYNLDANSTWSSSTVSATDSGLNKTQLDNIDIEFLQRLKTNMCTLYISPRHWKVMHTSVMQLPPGLQQGGIPLPKPSLVHVCCHVTKYLICSVKAGIAKL